MIEPHAMTDLEQRIENFLQCLGEPDPRFDPLDWFDLHVVAVAQAIDYETANPARIFEVWLEEQQLLDLDEDGRALLRTLISDGDIWEGAMRKLGWGP